MIARSLGFAAAIALAIAATPALAQFSSDEDAIRQLLGAGTVEETWFTPQFIAQVPLAQIREITEATREAIGPVTGIEKSSDGFVVHTTSHDMPVLIARDAGGAIAGLLLQPAVPHGVKLADATRVLDALPGQTAYLVTRNGETLVARNAEAPLAVGSAFKLAVLAALKEKIAAGAATWDQVVRLEARHISLPSGTLQLLPPGSPVTLHTLAALMIAISDNTATDALIDFVGRTRVAELLGTPDLIETREMFMLKADAQTRARYLAAGQAERHVLHEELDARPLPAATDVPGQHVEGIEYYVPLTRLCALMEKLGDEPVLGLNPGLAKKGDWARIGFKGGSEQGVLNLTTQVVDASGAAWCVAMTWNDDTALNETGGYAAYSALLAAIRNQIEEPQAAK